MKCIQQKEYKKQRSILEFQLNYKTPKNIFDNFYKL